MAKSPYKRWLLLGLSNVLLIAVLCEGGAHIVGPYIYGQALDRARLEKQFDEDSKSEAPAPSAWMPAMSVHPYMGFALKDGPFRGDNIRYEPAPDRVVVALTGGSVALGVYWHGRGAMAESLRRYEAFADKEIVIVPIALGGFKQPQQLMALAYHLVEEFHFDYVVNLDGYNEIMLPLVENMPSGVALSFPRAWQHMARGAYDSDTLDTALAVRALRNKRTGMAGFFMRPAIRSSTFALLVWKILDDRADQKIYELNSRLLNQQQDKETPAYVRGPATDYPDESEALAHAARIWENSSREMATLCAAADIQYFHFLQPNQYVAGSKALSAEERAAAYKGADSQDAHIIGLGYPLLQETGEVLSSEGIKFYDLTDLYQAEVETIYIDDCCHMSPKGYEIMAREIGRLIGE